MYAIHNLNNEQLAYIEDTFPLVKSAGVGDNDVLDIALKNSARLYVGYSPYQKRYTSSLIDGKTGYEHYDDCGRDTICGAIEMQITADVGYR